MTPTATPDKWPLPITVWEQGLKDYPNEAEKQQFINCLRNGFPTTNNADMDTEKNDMEYKNTIEKWITIYQTMDKRMGQHCAWGPFTEQTIPSQFKDYHANPVFVKDESKICTKTSTLKPKSRTIIDCSNTKHPGHAPNDFISEEEKSVKYPSIINVIDTIQKTGIKWMISADAENAFNRVPIDERYIKHYAIKLAGIIILWTALVFGGASSCAIYTVFAYYLGWMITQEFDDIFILDGIKVLINYLDDFFAGHKTKEGAWRQYHAIKYAFNKYGVPTQEKKMQIPTQRLKYIGFEIDTKQQQLEIPPEKLVKLRLRGKEILKQWKKKKPVQVHDIASFNGIVRYQTYVIYYIIPYLRRLEGAIANKQPTQWVKGNTEMMIDMKMIIEAVRDPERSKISFKWLLYPKDKGDICIETDASTTHGIGGIEMINRGSYYGITYKEVPQWPHENAPDIAFLELMAVYVAITINPQRYTGKAILLRVDNQAVCAIIRKKSACLERKDLQQLIRMICEIAIKYKFYLWVKWISTKDNK